MARVYKKIINIKHYGMFDKIVDVSKKGIFSVRYPVCIVQEDGNENNILQTDKCYSQTLKELEDEFNNYVREFISLNEEFKLVILYKWIPSRDYEDGSGFGFELNWGVFKKLNDSGYTKTYHYVRGQEKSENKPRISELRNGWKEIKWSEERECFFRNIIHKLQNTFDVMNQFFGASNIEDIVDDAIKTDNVLKLTNNK